MDGGSFMNGKGSRRRPENAKALADNWKQIKFKKTGLPAPTRAGGPPKHKETNSGNKTIPQHS